MQDAHSLATFLKTLVRFQRLRFNHPGSISIVLADQLTICVKKTSPSIFLSCMKIMQWTGIYGVCPRFFTLSCVYPKCQTLFCVCCRYCSFLYSHRGFYVMALSVCLSVCSSVCLKTLCFHAITQKVLQLSTSNIVDRFPISP